MLKFQFNYQNNTLAYQNPFETNWYEIIETFEGNFSSQGFWLADGYLTFTVYPSKIRAFFKQVQNSDPEDWWTPEPSTYFRKDLPKQAPVIFTFSSQDEVEKVGSIWVKKREFNHDK